MNVTVVVPTFNRGAKLRHGTELLLASDVTGISSVEIIVVDDGSQEPAENALSDLVVQSPFTLRVLKQANAGPATARNNGFHNSTGDIVIFKDDDVLPTAGLIRGHVEAHRDHPGCVIFGRYPLVETAGSPVMLRYLDSLGNDAATSATEPIIPVSVVASGHLSVMRSSFPNGEDVYRDDLKTAEAEEFELALRLEQRKIPILMATQVIGMHDSPADVPGYCRQQFRFGFGTVEAAVKYPGTMQISRVSATLRENGPVSPQDGVKRIFKKTIKGAFCGDASRSFFTEIAVLLEKYVPVYPLQAMAFHWVVSLSFHAGFREGFKEFGDPFKESRSR